MAYYESLHFWNPAGERGINRGKRRKGKEEEKKKRLNANDDSTAKGETRPLLL
jgi:hypothetical protein